MHHSIAPHHLLELSEQWRSSLAKVAHIRTSILDIAYEQSGSAGSFPVVLLHGYPYDARAFDEVTTIVNAAGFRTIAPYLRGYGPTRFLSPDTPRSGEQAAIGQDLLELLDALQIQQAVLAGFDWGARAACIVAAMWPERVRGLVTCAGYQIQDNSQPTKPVEPEQERRFWYQHYFQTERGRRGLTERREGINRLLWKLWSPTWAFDDVTFKRTAASYDNPDFIDVVIHSYRHRMGNAPGDPRYAKLEAQLSAQPKISVPTIVVHGAVNDVNPVRNSESHSRFFTGYYERRIFGNIGHNPPQEDPKAFAAAILDLCKRQTN
jgi:pimeloyl-ACP methyl ester carboxylesterase